MLMLLILHRLEYLASGIQVAGNRVEHAVDVSSTAIGAVEFCKVNVFVYRHRYGDTGECNHLGYCMIITSMNASREKSQLRDVSLI